MKAAAIRLDFEARPHAPARRFGAALLAFALLVAAGTGVLVWRATDRLQAAESRLARATQRSSGLRTGRDAGQPDRADTQTLAAIKGAGAIADQLSVPWEELFAALESADTHPLGLLSMVPNARDRSLRLTGEARSVADLLAYVERLASQPALLQAHLVGYGAAVRDGVPVVPFSIAASWRRGP